MKLLKTRIKILKIAFIVSVDPKKHLDLRFKVRICKCLRVGLKSQKCFHLKKVIRYLEEFDFSPESPEEVILT